MRNRRESNRALAAFVTREDGQSGPSVLSVSEERRANEVQFHRFALGSDVHRQRIHSRVDCIL